MIHMVVTNFVSAFFLLRDFSVSNRANMEIKVLQVLLAPLAQGYVNFNESSVIIQKMERSLMLPSTCNF